MSRHKGSSVLGVYKEPPVAWKCSQRRDTSRGPHAACTVRTEITTDVMLESVWGRSMPRSYTQSWAWELLSLSKAVQHLR